MILVLRSRLDPFRSDVAQGYEKVACESESEEI